MLQEASSLSPLGALVPSITHESLVDLFRDCPALASNILTHLGKLPPQQSQTPSLTAAEFADIKADEYRADAVIRIDDGTPDSTPSDVIIVEIQLARDDNKRRSWPVYMTGARARYRCPATILVFALDDTVAEWCAQPIALDRNGSTVKPVVVGPSQIPRITDLDQARNAPELAILSAIAHAQDDDTDEAADVALAGLAACDELDIDRANRYADFIYAVLGPAVLQALDSLMTARNYQPQSDFARYHAEQGRKEGEQAGFEAGKEAGKKAGLEAGKKAGLEAGQRAVILRQLTKRFGPLNPTVLAQVEQASVATLELWADRILFADTLDQVLSDSGHTPE